MRKIRTLAPRGLIVLCAALYTLSSPAVGAIDETFMMGNGIFHYNPGESCTQVENDTDSPVAVDGENLKNILTYFTKKGFSLAAAAGIAGNLNAESSLNPAKIQGGAIADDNYTPVNGVGFGLAQWTYTDRQGPLIAFAASKNAKITDLTMQLDFIWKEMKASSYRDMVSKLNGEKSDPVRAAVLFHGLTPNIEREGNGIHPVFAAAGAGYGFERSGDTSGAVVENRGRVAESFYNKYKTTITDGEGVANILPDSTNEPPTSAACNQENPSSSDLGVGDGNFTDSGEVAQWSSVLENAKASDAAFGGSLVGDGWCAAISSRVWRGQNIGYGYERAIDAWDAVGATVGHADRSPKKGALLLYRTNHVGIYLGDNKMLNDGQIVDASFPEKDWGLTYVGWIDPNDLGWKSVTASNIKEAVGTYGNQ